MASRRHRKSVERVDVLRSFFDESQWADAHLRMINFQMMCFSLSGTLLVLIYNDVCFDRSTLTALESLSGCPQALGGQLAAWVLYLLFVWRLVRYYEVRVRYDMRRWGHVSMRQAFFATNLWLYFLIELVVNAIMPLPSSLSWVDANTFLIGPMILRSYLVFRFARDYSVVYRNRKTILMGHKFQKYSQVDYEIDSVTILKTYFFKFSVWVLSLTFIGVFFYTAYMIHLAERQLWINDRYYYWRVIDHGGELPDTEEFYQTPFANYLNCCWFVIGTMTTLGIGDMVPLSWQGRFYTSFASLSGILLTSLIVGVVTNKLAPNEFQRFVIDWMRKRVLTHEYRVYATTILQTAWREHRKLREMTFEMDSRNQRQLRDKHYKAAIRPWIKGLRKARRKIYEIDSLWLESDLKFAAEMQSTLDTVSKRLERISEKVKSTEIESPRKIKLS